jgi:hypothetical protein
MTIKILNQSFPNLKEDLNISHLRFGITAKKGFIK